MITQNLYIYLRIIWIQIVTRDYKKNNKIINCGNLEWLEMNADQKMRNMLRKYRFMNIWNMYYSLKRSTSHIRREVQTKHLK